MTSLRDFLTARLDERAQLAEAAAASTDGDGWIASVDVTPADEDDYVDALSGYVLHNGPAHHVLIHDEGTCSAEHARHIALNDPKQVLADIAALRAVLAVHRPDGVWCEGCGGGGEELGWGITGYAHRISTCPTLRALALAYADHPDYDEAWRP